MLFTGDDQQASEATTRHIDFDDLYNDSFVPYRRSLVWVENGSYHCTNLLSETTTITGP